MKILEHFFIAFLLLNGVKNIMNAFGYDIIVIKRKRPRGIIIED